MRFAPADKSFIGRDFDDDGIALYRSADAERDAVGGGDGKGRGVGPDVGDLHVRELASEGWPQGPVKLLDLTDSTK